jgi:hypothetical protein
LPTPLKIKSITQVFNFKDLVNWVEPASTDFTDYSFKPVEQDEDYLNEFREVAEMLFPEAKRTPDRKEILLETSTSKCYSHEEKKTLEVWKAKSKKKLNSFASSIGYVKRCMIQKGPCEVRDSIILELPALNTVKLIES